MKKSNMVFIVGAALLMAAATGCSGNKEAKSDQSNNKAQTEVDNADIRGQWFIENIVFNDSGYVRPDETSSSITQYIVFEDSTYFIMTNCNSFNGSNTVKGDSIKLSDGAVTEIACDDMKTEDALRRILPHISTIDVQHTSGVRLIGSAPSEYILLRKAKTEIK